MDKAQNGEGTLFGNVTDLGKQFLSMDGAKKFAAWYIDNSEKMSNGVLDYQVSATEWAKKTRLGPTGLRHSLGMTAKKRTCRGDAVASPAPERVHMSSHGA